MCSVFGAGAANYGGAGADGAGSNFVDADARACAAATAAAAAASCCRSQIAAFEREGRSAECRPDVDPSA